MLGFSFNHGDVIALTICFALCYFAYLRYHRDLTPREKSNAYILHCSVTHSRRLPEPSRHAFTYPLLAFLFSLSDLESGKLSLLRGYLFSYGGIFLRVVGIRASGYLYDDRGAETSIRTKLVKTLKRFDVGEAEDLTGVWMMTMPSFLGWEGINPLTVYFCYKNNTSGLWLTVLEVHNTFSERHVYILETGSNEGTPPQGHRCAVRKSWAFRYDHQWTFPRTFHVSPFNDRLGTYTVAIRPPSHQPSVFGIEPLTSSMSPAVRITLHPPQENAPEDSPASTQKTSLKLVASWKIKRAVPLTIVGLLDALARHPISLLMTTPRILYHAFILHYRRFLAVWRRPEMLPVAPDWGHFRNRNRLDNDKSRQTKGGGIAWQRPTIIENLAADVIYSFIARRAMELDMVVVLQAGDPSIPPREFSHEDDVPHPRRTLTISYLSPRFFTLLLLAPNARTALTLGGPQANRAGDVFEFIVSDEVLFIELSGERASGGLHPIPNLQNFYGEAFPSSLLRRLRASAPQPPIGEVSDHFLQPRDFTEGILLLFLLLACVGAEWLECLLWKYLGVRWSGEDRQVRA
ncbi:hypothetical protein DENSPDRAFT_823943 [Dentipellis sp. KUC8613]|nr:hypothetical protein DENSPDRAFT_823943 [Dentipellis sp. KUC8613]